MTSPMSSVAPMVTPAPQAVPTTPSNIVPTTQPTTSPRVNPAVSPVPAQMGNNAADLETAKRIEGEVDKLSEIKKSAAIVNGSTAMVAIEYDTAYKGEMTDRIRRMVEEKVLIVDAGLREIVITDDPAMLGDVRDMRTRLDGGNVFEEIKAEFEKLMQRIKPTT